MHACSPQAGPAKKEAHRPAGQNERISLFETKANAKEDRSSQNIHRERKNPHLLFFDPSPSSSFFLLLAQGKTHIFCYNVMFSLVQDTVLLLKYMVVLTIEHLK